MCTKGIHLPTTPPATFLAENVLTLKASKMYMNLFLHQIWRNVALHHLFTNRSPAVNGCRQNESPKARRDGLKLKWWICSLQTCSFWRLKTLIDGLEWCGLLWCFISCLDSHYDGTHSLQSIHCWETDEMLHFSKSDEETNSATSWISQRWVIFFSKCLFLGNYSFSIFQKYVLKW